MDKILRIGIAGYGVVGKKRKKILDSIPGLKIVAISDKNPKNKILNKNAFESTSHFVISTKVRIHIFVN